MTSDAITAWCTPRTVLVLAHPCDDPARVLTAVRYAGIGNARVILAQLSVAPRPAAEARFRRRRAAFPIIATERPAGIGPQWTGVWNDILSQAFLLGNIRIEDVAGIAVAMRADRILLSTPQLAEAFWQESELHNVPGLIETPILVLGKRVGAEVPERMGRILLPLSLRNEFATRLRMACHLANASGATLAILHVVPRSALNPTETSTPWTVRSRLQQLFDNCSEVLCPMEISIRDGDPVEGILKFDGQHPHDLVILRVSNEPGGERRIRGAVRRVLNGAHCPVLLIQAHEWKTMELDDKLAQKAGPPNVMLDRVAGGVQ